MCPSSVCCVEREEGGRGGKTRGGEKKVQEAISWRFEEGGGETEEEEKQTCW